MTLLSTFGGGLFIIPILTLLGAVLSFRKAYISHNSNSTQSTKGGLIDNTGNVPYTQIGSFWFGVIFVASTIVIVLMMHLDR